MKSMKQPAETSARLEARLPAAVLARLKRAAEIQGRSLTDFVVAAADEAACRALERTEIIRVALEDQERIWESLVNPPPPTPDFKKAVRLYRKLIRPE